MCINDTTKHNTCIAPQAALHFAVGIPHQPPLSGKQQSGEQQPCILRMSAQNARNTHQYRTTALRHGFQVVHRVQNRDLQALLLLLLAWPCAAHASTATPTTATQANSFIGKCLLAMLSWSRQMRRSEGPNDRATTEATTLEISVLIKVQVQQCATKELYYNVVQRTHLVSLRVTLFFRNGTDCQLQI